MATNDHTTHGTPEETRSTRAQAQKPHFDAVAMQAGAFSADRERLFGARARMAALTVAKTQDELRRDFEDDPETLTDLSDTLAALSDECKAVLAIADAAAARLLIVGQEICGEMAD